MSRDSTTGVYTVHIDDIPVTEQKPGNPKLESYSLESIIKNTTDRPHLEENTVMPHLVRRVDSVELLPSPWKSVNCLLACSYLGVLLCCLTGAFSNRYAWKAHKFRSMNKHHYTKKYAKKAVICLYLSFGIAAVTAILVTTLVLYA